MAGAFSGHLVDSFHAQQAAFQVPFRGSPTPQIVTSGAMSFDSRMHGTPVAGSRSMGDYSFSFGTQQPSFYNPELSEASILKIAALQAKLNQKLGPEYISQRPGPGGGPKLTYAEGWKIINLANEVFGFNGWSSSVVSLTTDFCDFNEESRRYNVGTTAIIRVTLRDGVYHEDIGYGLLENSKSKGSALDKCKKEAVTDGLKRALRSFGNLLGNCLYDKSYAQEVVKIKVQPPKFDKSELHRRPEFADVKPDIASLSTPITSSTSHPVSAQNPSSGIATPTRPPPHAAQPPAKTASSLPAHIRSEINTASPSSHNIEKSTNALASSSSTTARASGRASANYPSSSSIAHQHISMTRAISGTSFPPPKEVDCQRPTVNLSRGNDAPTSGISNVPRLPPTDNAQPQEVKALPLENSDESFHFNSDDDAFLALVDLGEGDLGQPLLPETDLGRPIEGDDDEQSFSNFSGQMLAESTLAMSPEESKGPSPPTGILTRLLPQQQQAPRSTNQFSSGRKPGSNQNLPYQQQPQRSTSTNNQFSNAHKPPPPRSSNENQLRSHNDHQPQKGHHQNQNQPPAAAMTGANSTGQRPSTPSMGGFRFPSGIDPHVRQAMPQVSAQGHSATSSVGVKRSLDVMSSSTNMKQGAVNTGQVQPKREVFGRLDLSDGGDVKRIRR